MVQDIAKTAKGISICCDLIDCLILPLVIRPSTHFSLHYQVAVHVVVQFIVGMHIRLHLQEIVA